MDPATIQPSASWELWPWITGLLPWIVLAVVVSTLNGFEWPVTALGLAGLVVVFVGIRAVRRAQASRSIGEASLGSLGDQDGAVTVEGTAELATDSVTAPVTGSERVVHRVQVERDVPGMQDDGI